MAVTLNRLLLKSTNSAWGEEEEEADFEDGGAFPEIIVVQYPQDMGKPDNESTSNAVAVQLDHEGKVKYDVIARKGHRKDEVSEEEIEETIVKTRQAIEKLIDSKIAAAMPVRAASKQKPVEFIRYTSSQDGPAFNSGAKQRVIKMVELQKDPMEPPRFKLNKKIPRGPPSPPAPVIHSPPRKVTVDQRKKWQIPPCPSLCKGYTIPLDKRLAADGRGLQQVHINEKFARVAEALYIADRKAREAVEVRAQVEKRMTRKEKERKEEHLRALAQKVREEKAGIKSDTASFSTTNRDDERQERDILRMERHKERARDRNLARAAPYKRNKLQKARERDISEQIALGLPAKTIMGGEGQFDQRLFDGTKGMNSGFGDDDIYNVYDKPWRNVDSMVQHVYRPCNIIKDMDYVGERSQATGHRSGPVKFEKEDPFGLDKFLTQVKKAKKTSKKRKISRGEKENMLKD